MVNMSIFLQERQPTSSLDMVRALDPSIWMMLPALEPRADWLTVPTLPIITASTLKMLESVVRVGELQ